MSVDFWDLFWITGMPEAWLMSRDREIPIQPGMEQGGIQGLSGTAPFSGQPLGGVPGNSERLY